MGIMSDLKFKKTILIDLDGVLNQYKGDFDENYIPEIKPGAKEFIEELSKEFTIKLFTTRNKILASRWLFIDDRCIRFDGNFENLHKKILNFKPWYK